LLGECENCGVKNLAICPVEEEGTFGHLINWKHFFLQTILIRKGEEKKKLTLVYKTTMSIEFIKYLKLNL
jgi:hypothetical protein